jgi:hypothetical protein
MATAGKDPEMAGEGVPLGGLGVSRKRSSSCVGAEGRRDKENTPSEPAHPKAEVDVLESMGKGRIETGPARKEYAGAAECVCGLCSSRNMGGLADPTPGRDGEASKQPASLEKHRTYRPGSGRYGIHKLSDAARRRDGIVVEHKDPGKPPALCMGQSEIG